MTRSFQTLIFFTIVSTGLISPALCGIFDYTDVEDPFAFVWSTRDQLIREPNSACQAVLEDSSVIHGVCKNRAECRLSGGIPRQSCGIFSACCTYAKSCGGISSAKITNFQSGNTLNAFSKPCHYTVKLHNKNICQMRIDLVRMNLAPPSMDNSSMTVKCNRDLFFVDKYPKIPLLCGNNDGQHLYVPVNATEGTTSITLSVIMTDRYTNPHLPIPNWHIRVTQLECPGPRSAFSTENSAATDFNLIAPAGCLQYNPERKGTFKSFAFDVTSPNISRYIVNQKYAICFKRPKDACGIKLNANYFQISPQYGRAESTCSDYLFIPGLASPSDMVGKVCDQRSGTTFVSDTPGPLYVYFQSDGTSDVTGDTDKGMECSKMIEMRSRQPNLHSKF